jgi:hypothetical protein
MSTTALVLPNLLKHQYVPLQTRRDHDSDNEFDEPKKKRQKKNDPKNQFKVNKVVKIASKDTLLNNSNNDDSIDNLNTSNSSINNSSINSTSINNSSINNTSVNETSINNTSINDTSIKDTSINNNSVNITNNIKTNTTNKSLPSQIIILESSDDNIITIDSENIDNHKKRKLNEMDNE